MRLSLILMFTCSLAGANTLTNASFGQPETNCNYSHTAPYTTATCPVIGNPLLFEVQSISVSVVGNTVTATIDFNTGGGLSLSPFTDGGITLQPGDLLFFDPSDPSQTQKYGVAIDSSRPNSQSFIAGDLYQIGGNISLETAQTALGNPNAYYRNNQQVLMTDSSTPGVAGVGDGVHVVALGNGISEAEYAATVQFTATAGFLDLFQNGSIGVDFAAADCGNAILDGVTNSTPTPEPADEGLMALGIVFIGAAGYWRKRSARQAS